ncbi:hypothetical protein SAMN06295905_2548 [Devosia lucknowensis]|uniref:Uncharacterized protein n=1 Tax=Devosia lucknowensis TaxID=1096929 RepID=A0A1Y6G4W2_9HYPH|nr:hypothetical protein [Devosia lucknowensis]SMQ85271.1 hypothetical protein SAMN06295905_2548 [Devosia lucknowensis]
MLQILVIMAGSLLAAIGWLVRRRIRNEAVDEIIKRRLSLVELHHRMKAEGIDANDLSRLETEMISLGGAKNQAQTPRSRLASVPPGPVERMNNV